MTQKIQTCTCCDSPTGRCEDDTLCIQGTEDPLCEECHNIIDSRVGARLAHLEAIEAAQKDADSGIAFNEVAWTSLQAFRKEARNRRDTLIRKGMADNVPE